MPLRRGTCRRPARARRGRGTASDPETSAERSEWVCAAWAAAVPRKCPSTCAGDTSGCRCRFAFARAALGASIERAMPPSAESPGAHWNCAPRVRLDHLLASVDAPALDCPVIPAPSCDGFHRIALAGGADRDFGRAQGGGARISAALRRWARLRRAPELGPAPPQQSGRFARDELLRFRLREKRNQRPSLVLAHLESRACERDAAASAPRRAAARRRGRAGPPGVKGAACWQAPWFCIGFALQCETFYLSGPDWLVYCVCRLGPLWSSRVASLEHSRIAPFGKEDTAKELQDHAAKTQDTLVDAVENAEVAEIKRAVFRALTRLRAATIKEFDTIARLETQAIDAYNDAHHYRAENPLAHLHEDEAPVETDKLKSFH
ncbi:unnamed protein product [Prorocentrum cordatum]|uniref:Uncharacterized protein n=1 Tax=Prorocentrum cordatum TaxID=2364126 RepID=A0ABN9PLF8_9DINO|nr:unnamed protein product [Polarella glacialis]